MKKITTNQAKELLQGCAVIPGLEAMVLGSQGYEIQDDTPFKSEVLNPRRSSYINESVNSYAQVETQDYHVLCASIRHADYSGSGGVEKWTKLQLEFAPKSNLDEVVSLNLESLKVADAYESGFNSFNASLINTEIEEVAPNIVKARYLNPERNNGINIQYDLVNKRVVPVKNISWMT